MIAGLRSLRPDRALLPRRGAARRSPARVHAGRPRDVVRDRGLVFEIDRAADRRGFKEIGVEVPRPFPAHAVRRGDRQVRLGQAGPALRHGDRGLSAGVRRVAVRRLPRGGRGRRRGARVRRFPARRSYSRRELDELVEQAKQLGAAGARVGATPRRAACRVRRSRRSAKTTHPRGARDRQAPAPDDLLRAGRGQARRRRRRCSASCACRWRRRENLLDPNAVRVLLGRRLPAVRVGPEDEQRLEFMHHPFTAPLEERHGAARDATRARCGRRPTTSF